MHNACKLWLEKCNYMSSESASPHIFICLARICLISFNCASSWVLGLPNTAHRRIVPIHKVNRSQSFFVSSYRFNRFQYWHSNVCRIGFQCHHCRNKDNWGWILTKSQWTAMCEKCRRQWMSGRHTARGKGFWCWMYAEQIIKLIIGLLSTWAIASKRRRQRAEGMRRWTPTGFPNHQYLQDFCLSNDLSLFLFDTHSGISFLTRYLFWLPFDSMLSCTCLTRCSLPLTCDGLVAFSLFNLCISQATLVTYLSSLYYQLLLIPSAEVFRATKIVKLSMLILFNLVKFIRNKCLALNQLIDLTVDSLGSNPTRISSLLYGEGTETVRRNIRESRDMIWGL